MQNSIRWTNYLKKAMQPYHSPLQAAVDHWQFNQRVYSQIKKVVPPPASILDIGVGFGFSSLYLQACGYQVVGLDNDQYALETARQNAAWLNPDVQVEYGDIFDLTDYYGRFELAFSAGVMEHFERKTTVALLREQAKCAHYVMTTIPTKNTHYAAPITDEHFYSPRQFRQLFKEAGLVDVKSWGFGDTPSLTGRLARYLLPLLVYRFLLNQVNLGMGIGCVGRSLVFQPRPGQNKENKN